MNQQREDDDGKGDVEQHQGAGHVHHHGRDGKGNRYGAAQSDPADVGDFARTVAEKFERSPDSQRAGDEDEEGGDDDGFRAGFNQSGGADQQAEDEEHRCLGQPGQAVHHIQNVFSRTVARIADEHACQVNRQKAAAAEQVGNGEHQQAARGD